jgi:hypothetical protein
LTHLRVAQFTSLFANRETLREEEIGQPPSPISEFSPADSTLRRNHGFPVGHSVANGLLDIRKIKIGAAFPIKKHLRPSRSLNPARGVGLALPVQGMRLHIHHEVGSGDGLFVSDQRDEEWAVIGRTRPSPLASFVPARRHKRHGT